MPVTYEVRTTLRKVVVTVVAWAFAAVIAFPLFWMVSSSLKGPQEILSTPPTLWPRDVVFDNYRQLFGGDFFIWFRNSVVVAGLTTALVIGVGTLGGYSLTRFRYPGRHALGTALLSAYLLPQVLMIVPLFLIIGRFNLLDTLLALVLANSTFALPFAVWLLRSYFQSIPVQVEDAARVDGASRLRGFVEVVLPQALPGIISTAIFTFILAWNDYLFALVFISSASRKTLPVGIATFANELYTQWGPLMAASVAVTIPVLIFFIFIQRRLVGGFGAGAVKG